MTRRDAKWCRKSWNRKFSSPESFINVDQDFLMLFSGNSVTGEGNTNFAELVSFAV